MISGIENLFSKNANNLKRSVIRELLKLTNKPEIISFAGGLPAPQTFPKEELTNIVDEVITKDGAKSLQYGATEGDEMLKEEIIKLLEKDGIENLKMENVLPVTASQQALDMCAKIFVNPEDPIILGMPSYVGAIGAFRSYRADMIGVPLQEDGMDMEILEEKVKKIKKEGRKLKFVYVIPDFQNPAGITMSEAKRKKLLELAYKYNFLIIEDSPYRNLRYTGENVPSIYSLDDKGYTVSLYTFSKIFAPGFRLGWIIGPDEIIDKFVVAKQAMDLCTPPFSQRIAAYYMKEGYLKKRIEKNVKLYRKRRKAMLDALEKYMPKRDDISWTKPEGGMFLWLTVPEFVDTEDMFYKAIDENVAYVVGNAFYVDDDGSNTCRLNFSYCSKEKIEEGIKRLSDVVKQEIEEKEVK
ncbi:MAG: PLP-dependent aminotransferase family protein [Candidatus Mcinerneyibacterium aminivorans]|uniref:PLP-dependent aminotransferase family protein n=1 Tax=Candidatus Mcinerneyibacterium aminivorans TaxID=2703815 RepID=A0A5D0MGV7_9BACT|nr:MAG: PLP-dependent aminotransferase family protein [Candidatus Mcinerneyibacterium aminivorans]